MAVTRGPQVILMTADSDAVTGNLIVQGIKATGAVAAITDAAGAPIAAFAAEGSVEFPYKLLVSGVTRGAGAGHLYVYIH